MAKKEKLDINETTNCKDSRLIQRPVVIQGHLRGQTARTTAPTGCSVSERCPNCYSIKHVNTNLTTFKSVKIRLYQKIETVQMP